MRRLEAMVRRQDPEPQHAFQVRKNAVTLFDALSSVMTLDKSDRRLLEAAALLHDMGHTIGPQQHHKHSRDLIRRMQLNTFTAVERDMIACVARYHRKAHPKSSHAVFRTLSDVDKQRVRILAAILRVADGLDRAHDASCADIKVTKRRDTISLKVTQRKPSPMDIDGARRKSQLFEEVFGKKLEITAKLRKGVLNSFRGGIAALIIFVSLVGCHTTPPSAPRPFQLQPGDLLFQDLDGSPLCDAIETVTQGVDGAKFSHVGMVSRIDKKSIFIIEAVGEGVVETELSAFLARSEDDTGHPKVLVGRLTDIDDQVVDRAIDVARGFLGRPYDKIFVMENSAFYCSELLYESFRVANHGDAILELNPMTFKDPSTGQTFPAWTTYYADLRHEIPEGEPGLNPGGMSSSPRVAIVHAYGVPAGWRGDSVRP